MKTKKFLLLISLLIPAACGHKSSSESEDSIVAVETTNVAEEVPVKSENIAYITGDSIGCIKVGMSVNDIPAAVPGLYTRKEPGASEDAVTILFIDENGERFITYDFGEAVIDVINVIGRDVKVKTPDGDFGLGDSFLKVLTLPGVETEWMGYDGTGMWYWKWNGLWIAPAQEGLPEKLTRTLYNPQNPPGDRDFSPSVTVGFIGTGLPF